MEKRAFNKENGVRFLIGVLILFVMIGVCMGLAEVARDVTRPEASRVTPVSVAPSPSVSYNLSLPGEAGFWEYHKSINYQGSKESALDAGYTVCSLVGLIGRDQTWYELRRQSSNERDAERLLYASIHYLCPQYASDR